MTSVSETKGYISLPHPPPPPILRKEGPGGMTQVGT
jgi:hypothetical protein